MIFDQLKSYCTCLKDVTEEDVSELVNLISIATCWARRPCETFLKSERTELIDLPDCMDCPMDFTPFYDPYDVDSFTFSLITIEGMEETITQMEFTYSETMGVFHVDTKLPRCKCGCRKCGCKPVYKMLVTYTAGYEELPDCLLPVFCNVLEVIHAKNTCDCTECGCENGTENDVTYAKGDVVTVALETDIGHLLVETYKNQIGMISLCKARPRLWGIVV